jgi:hypothetical protein
MYDESIRSVFKHDSGVLYINSSIGSPWGITQRRNVNDCMARVSNLGSDDTASNIFLNGKVETPTMLPSLSKHNKHGSELSRVTKNNAVIVHPKFSKRK